MYYLVVFHSTQHHTYHQASQTDGGTALFSPYECLHSHLVWYWLATKIGSSRGQVTPLTMSLNLGRHLRTLEDSLHVPTSGNPCMRTPLFMYLWKRLTHNLTTRLWSSLGDGEDTQLLTTSLNWCVWDDLHIPISLTFLTAFKIKWFLISITKPTK